MSVGGRPKHSVWNMGFNRMKDPIIDNKYNALCMVCHKTLRKTSVDRLKTQRNICLFTSIPIPTKSSSPESISNLMVSNNASKRKRIFINTSDSSDSEQIDTPNENKLKETPLTISQIGSVQHKMIHLDLFQLHVVHQIRQILMIILNFLMITILITLLKYQQIQHQKPQKNPFNSTSKKNRKRIKQCYRALLDLFVIKLHHLKIDKCNLALAKLFFGCNIPFSVIKSLHFKNFCQSLRPAYKVPTRKVLSGRLLDDVFMKFCQSNSFKKNSALLIDGWINESANTKNVACMLHSSSGEAMFLESFDMTGVRETSTELCKIVESCIDLAKEKNNTDIYAVITDNAANMVKMGRLSTLWHLTCNAHTANLLAKDLVPSDITAKVKQILKAFHRPDLEKELLFRGGYRFQLPCETRWCSYHLLLEIHFVSDYINLFDPICVLINKCQSSKSNIADAAEEWLSLELSRSNNNFAANLENRRSSALTEYALAANFLHPKYNGLRFRKDNKHDDMDVVESFFLSVLDVDGLNSLNDYKTKQGIFSTLFEKKNLNYQAFWSYAKNKNVELAELAESLLA
ncbi:hypothetical protein QTP88_028223 [Uroleucon formosanum]